MRNPESISNSRPLLKNVEHRDRSRKLPPNSDMIALVDQDASRARRRQDEKTIR